jgi:hypothetical protein
LDAGNRLAAAQALVSSIVRRPRLDRRTLLLAKCFMPERLSTVLRDLRPKLRLRRRSRAALYQEQRSA